METEKSTVCYQQVGDPGKQVLWFHTKEPGEPMVWVPDQGQEKMNVPAQQAKRVTSPCFSLFVPSRPSVDWTISTHTGDSDCHHQFADPNANADLFWKYLPRMIPIQKMLFYKQSGHPLAQSRWHKISHHRDCSHEMKRRLLLGREAVTNLGSIVKSRDITLPTKVHIVKAMVFPAVMYGCESWKYKEGWE